MVADFFVISNLKTKKYQIQNLFFRFVLVNFLHLS